MKIEIGEYVRTKNGHIGKVIDISHITGQSRKKYLIKWNISKAYYITNITIIKSSKNIIDLIEVGDIVNGSKVIDIAKGNIKALYLEQVNSGALIPTIDKDIKTILTHEQFKQNCYRLEENNV